MTVTAVTSFPQFLEIVRVGAQGRHHRLLGRMVCAVQDGQTPVRTSDDHGAVAKFYSVDIEQQDDISQEVRIALVPTFMAFKNGNSIGTVSSFERELISAFVAKHAPVN